MKKYFLQILLLITVNVCMSGSFFIKNVLPKTEFDSTLYFVILPTFILNKIGYGTVWEPLVNVRIAFIESYYGKKLNGTSKLYILTATVQSIWSIIYIIKIATLLKLYFSLKDDEFTWKKYLNNIIRLYPIFQTFYIWYGLYAYVQDNSSFFV